MAIQIETERLIVREPRAGDVDGVAQWVTDPEVMRHLGGAPPLERAEIPGVIERWLRVWREDRLGHFVAERREDGNLVGRVGFIVWDRRDWVPSSLSQAGAEAEVELAWTLARASWGNGYATEAAAAVREWGRTERNVGRLISLISPENERSQRVAERLGALPTVSILLRGKLPVVVWVHPDA